MFPRNNTHLFFNSNPYITKTRMMRVQWRMATTGNINIGATRETASVKITAGLKKHAFSKKFTTCIIENIKNKNKNTVFDDETRILLFFFYLQAVCILHIVHYKTFVSSKTHFKPGPASFASHAAWAKTTVSFFDSDKWRWRL